MAANAMKTVLSGEPLLHKGCDSLTLLEVQQNHPFNAIVKHLHQVLQTLFYDIIIHNLNIKASYLSM